MSQHSTMGSYLAAARRHRQVSIQRAAEETRIRPDFLERLEADDFDFLAPPYVRGFLRSYARFLRVPEAPLLAEFDRLYGDRSIRTDEILAASRESKPGPARRTAVPAVGAASTKPRSKQTRLYREPSPRSSWKAAGIAAAVIFMALFVIGLVVEDRPAGRQGSAPRTGVAAADAGQDEGSRTPASEPRAGGREGSGDRNRRISARSLALDNGIDLTIVASRGRCWVSVESDGVEAFTGTIPKGERRSVSASETMDVVLGYGPGVELIVNGHNIGSPGGSPGSPVVGLSLPDDIKTLL